MSKNKFAVFLAKDGAGAKWQFFESVDAAREFARVLVEVRGKYDTAKIFEQTFVASYQNRDKLNPPEPVYEP